MAQLQQYWLKFHDVKGGATAAGQPIAGTTPEVFLHFACSSETFLCQISRGKGSLILLNGMVLINVSASKTTKKDSY